MTPPEMSERETPKSTAEMCVAGLLEENARLKEELELAHHAINSSREESLESIALFTPEGHVTWRQVMEGYKRVSELEAKLAEYAKEVREWLCEACNTVYPGPPQEGLHCVTCPKCQGTTLPRTLAERRRAEQALTQTAAKQFEWLVTEKGASAALEGVSLKAQLALANILLQKGM